MTFVLAYFLMLGQVSLQASNVLTLDLELTSSYATCDVSSDGSVTASVSGGNPPYTYDWSVPNPGDPWKLDDVPAGVYSVTVTDSDGETISGSEEVELSPEGIWVMVTVEAEVGCEGGNSGVLHAGPMTGVAPYTYLWSDGQTTQDAFGLSAGTYCVTVTDANGCSGVECGELEEGDSDLSVELTSSYATCDVSSDASVTASTSGGNPLYTYEWSVPNNGPDPWKLEDVPAGTYSVTVTDDSGCSVVATEEVELSPEGIWVMVTIEQENECAGDANAIVHAGPMTGVPPYTYLWSDGQTTQDAVDVEAGTICVTVTDSNGCAGEECIDVEDPEGMDLDISKVDADCGLANGSASVDVSGGESPYTYLWSNGGTDSSIDNLSAGPYSVTVTDDNDCTAVADIVVGETGGISVTVSTTPATCGEENGTATATASGGSGNYSYDWGGGLTDNPITGLAPGTYTVIVTDTDTGCTATANGDVDETNAIDLSMSSTMASCNANDGTATATPSGGVDPYTYAWSNGGSTQTITGLAPGTYTVTVTDAVDCTAVGSVEVGQDPNCCEPAEIVSVVIFEAHCNEEDGSATITVVGNPDDYIFDWSPTGGPGPSSGGLAPGTYTVVITNVDDPSCSITETFTISTVEGPEVNVEVTPSTCGLDDGTATITPVDPAAVYEYQWSNPPGGTSNMQTGLAEGEYQVTVIDPNNPACPTVETVMIPGVSPLEISVEKTPADCGEANGTATINVTGGTAPYSYTWSNGATGDSQNNLAAGMYTVDVEDANGCDGSISFVIEEDGDPVVVTIDPTDVSVSCVGATDGTVTYTVTPQVPVIIVDGNGVEQTNGQLAPGNYCIIVLNADDCLTGSACFDVTAPPQIDVDINATDVTCNALGTISLVNITGGTGDVADWTITWIPDTYNGLYELTDLEIGDYTFTLTDINNCSVSETISISLDSTAFDLAMTSTNASCDADDGTATATPSGGTSPYTYLWNTGGVTQTITDLAPGTYTVTVTDADDCTSVGSVEVVRDPDCCEPAEIVSVVIFEANCNEENGSATITVVGDPNDYTFEWSPAGGPGPSSSGLAPGTYTVVITNVDDPACSITEVFTISTVEGPEVTVEVTPSTCGLNDGTATITPVDPAAVYEYVWSTPPGGNSNMQTGLAEGEYQVTVIDPNDPSCRTIETVVIEGVSPLNVTVTTTPADCGQANGTATVSVTGGTAPYSYNWSNGGTGDTQNNLAAGVYTVDVEDANGCDGSITFVITETGDPVVITIDPTDVSVSCVGATDGTVTYTVEPPNPVVIIDDNGVEQTNGQLAPGTYCIIAVSADSCLTGSACFEVTSPPQIDVDINSTDVTCNELGTISLVNITGGTGGYTINWDNGSTGCCLTELEAGAYTFTLTDGNGCSVSELVTVGADSTAINVTLSSTPVSCTGDDGTVTIVSITGGTAPYDTLWYNGATAGSVMTGLSMGSYSVTITDANGCTGVGTTSVGEDCIECEPPVISSVVVVETNCMDSTGTATITLVQDNGYTWIWSPDVSNSNSATGLWAGAYYVTIVDPTDSTCVITESFTVGTVDGPEATLVTAPATCTQANGVAFFNPDNFSYTWPDLTMGSGRNDLTAGEYFVTITDLDNPNCIDVVTVVIDEFNPLEIGHVVDNNPNCGVANGTATVSVVNGGSGGPYTYVWNETITDIGITSTQGGLLSGVHNVVVTDSVSGCNQELSFILTDSVDQATVTIDSVIHVSCIGAADGAVIYTVDPAGLTEVILDTNGNEVTNGQLGPGRYCVQVTDAAGCVAGFECFDVEEPEQIDVDVAVYDAACDSLGSITLLNIVGGTGDYSVVWAPGGETTFTIDSLEAGLYSFTLSDENNCTAGTTVEVEDVSTDLDVVITQDSFIMCFGDSTAALSVVVSEGIPPYGILWSTGATSNSISNLSAGPYSVTVTDSNGCTGADTIFVEQPPEIFLEVQDTIYACEDTINIFALTGSFINLEWFNKDGTLAGTGNPLEVIIEGDTCFYVEATDSLGCTVKDSVYVVDGGEVFADFTWEIICGDTVVVDFFDQSTTTVGSITSWTWDINGMIYNEQNPSVEFYISQPVVATLWVTNAAGCTDSLTHTFPVGIIPDPDPNQFDLCLGDSIILYPNAELNMNYTYEWSPATYLNDPTLPSPICTAEENITYTVTVNYPDSSCQRVYEVQVSINPTPIVDILTQDTVLCQLGDVTLTASGTGNTYTWYEGQTQVGTGETITVGTANSDDPYYVVEMSDGNGCVAKDTVMVADYSIGLMPFPDALVCLGDSAFLQPILTLGSPGVEHGIEWTPDEHVLNNPDILDVWVAPTETTTFEINVSNDFCSITEEALVKVTDVSAEIEAQTENDTICLGQSTNLLVTGSTGTYEWLQPGAATLDFDNVDNPVATPIETTEYTVRVTDADLCSGTASVRVVVIDPECREPFIFFPNAFSPNGDGRNDELFLRGFNADEVHFIIYNRWGEKVFESNSQAEGWNGRYRNTGDRLDPDVYGFYLTVRCTNGEFYNKKGNVTLLR